MKKLIILVVTLLYLIPINGKAEMRIYITKVNSLNGEVTADVLIKNESQSVFYIYGANICTSQLLDKSLFNVLYEKNGIKNKLEFSGPIGEGKYGFVAMKPLEQRRCSVRLDFNYIFPRELGFQYSVQYIIENPEYENIQKAIVIKSDVVNFVR